MIHDNGSYTVTLENGSTITALSSSMSDSTCNIVSGTISYDRLGYDLATYATTTPSIEWSSPLVAKSELDEVRTLYECRIADLGARIDYLESRLERILEFISQSVKDTGAISEQDLATLLLL